MPRPPQPMRASGSIASTDFYTTPVRSGPAATVCMVLGLALTLLACGSGGDESGSGARPRTVEKKSAGPASPSACRRQLRPFLGAMGTLRSRLAVGLSYEDYLDEVRGVKVAHARVAADRLRFGCLALAGAPAERALNEYVDAVNVWGDCLAAASCDPESVEPRLQRIWQRASDRLATAQAGLRRISSG